MAFQSDTIEGIKGIPLTTYFKIETLYFLQFCFFVWRGHVDLHLG